LEKHIERRLTMKKGYQRGKEFTRGSKVYVGIDVHKDSWHVTAVTEGEEVFNGRLPSQYPVLRKLLDRFAGREVKVAYEAGPCGFWLHDRLTGDGIETIVVPPSLIPLESGNRVKTDKRDSRKLAHLLEKGMLKRVFVLSEEERMHRELVRTRRQLMEHRADVMKQIKSKLLFHGIEYAYRSWNSQFIRWLRELIDSHRVFAISLGFMIDIYEHLTDQLKKITKQVFLLTKNEKYARNISLLRTIPGIGRLIAIEILVELQDMKRFKSAERLASYIGLTPSEYSTGQYTRQGRITRCGNTRVRTCLVEGSWVLIYRDPVMKNKYEKLKIRKGAKRAIIAIARNLIIRIRSMVLNNEPYHIGSIAR
jgi:transposase